jgi:alpha-tubulin suppressor-like RCC1 family protein
MNDGTLNGVIAIASSYGFNCALLSNGTVWCWGMGQYGQLGDGFKVNRSKAVSVYNLWGAIGVSVSFSHSCAVSSDQRVRCWGQNDEGQLGTGDTVDSPVAMWVVNLSNAIAVAVGDYHNCALLADHSLRCWGSGAAALGVTDALAHYTPVVSTTLTDVAAISSSDDASCAIRQNGTVACWGQNGNNYELAQQNVLSSSTALQVAGLTGVVNLEMGAMTACAVLPDATARCWGSGAGGILGDGKTANSYALVDSGATNVAAVGVGFDHACAVHRDGTVSCWGSNTSGQLGLGTVDSTIHTRAAVPGLTGVVALSLGGAHTCALGADTRVRCWGANTVGQVGNGTTSTSVVSPGVVQASAQ